MKNIKAAII